MKRLANFQPLWLAALAASLHYASLPPLGMKYLIFLTPAIWLLIVVGRFEDFGVRKLAKGEASWARRVARNTATFFLRTEYRAYWFVAFVFWLATLYWVSFPHPATIAGWIALSAYLAFYFPLLIFQSRVLTRVARLSPALAVPLAFLSCEALRNVALGGFSFAAPSHAIYDVPVLLQSAAFFGEYGVNVMIALVGALIGRAFWRPNRAETKEGEKKSRVSARWLSFAAIVLGLDVVYGIAQIRTLDALAASAVERGARPLRLALLQDETCYRFPLSLEKNLEVSDRYLTLAREAANDPRGYDAIIWPEGTFFGQYPCYFDASFDLPRLFDLKRAIESPETDAVERERAQGDMKREFPEYLESSLDLLERQRDATRRQRRELTNLTARLGAPAILGYQSAICDQKGDLKFYNSAVFVPYLGDEKTTAIYPLEKLEGSPTSNVVENDPRAFRRYDKTDLVMFGEFIPFSKYLPESWEIKSVCAQMELGRGEGPTPFEIVAKDGADRYIVSTHICFESSIPHYVTGQATTLRASGIDPDVLCCISNDGWFRHCSEIDLHLATQVYRAIENRRHLVAATHGGFSAHVDPCGRIREKGERGATQVVGAEFHCVKSRPSGLIAYERDGERREFYVCDVVRRVGYAILAITILTAIFARICARKTKRES